MSDEELFREWTANDAATQEQVRRAVEAALAEDRLAHRRGQLVRLSSIGLASLLWIVLLWCSANGVTPVVRGGYALMAAGIAVMLFAQFAYASWSDQAQPGPSDSLTQIRTGIFMLRRQGALVRSAPAWCAPIFVGAGLVGWWIYAERSHLGAVALWLAVATGWFLSVVGGNYAGRELDARRSRLEQVLTDLHA